MSNGRHGLFSKRQIIQNQKLRQEINQLDKINARQAIFDDGRAGYLGAVLWQREYRAMEQQAKPGDQVQYLLPVRKAK